MNTFHRLFRPLHTALQVIFARDLTLRRGEGGVEIVLAERQDPGKPRKSSRSEAQQQKERAELALMHSQLTALLDDQPDTRSTLRHLVFVEQTLARKGWRVLHKMPLDVLQRALEQLEGLVVNWSPEGLANLRSKMAVAIIDREHMDPDAEADAYRTAMPMDAAPHPEEADEAPAADDAALAAAYAAALGPAAVSATLAPILAPTPAPTPAALSAEVLATVQAHAQATLAEASSTPDEALEFHNELGSQSARAQPRENLAGRGKLPPIKLRELQG